jgi:glutathione S-transferase
MSDRVLTLFHAKHSRSEGVRLLLAELGAPYELRLLDLGAEEQMSPEFCAINPLSKVPALRHGETVVTEQVAIFIYLADYFAAAGLAPGPTDADRGTYLRWMAFYGASFEPALVDHFMQREPGARRMSPYGSYDAVIDAVSAALTPGPYFLGDRFSAVDILWGMALSWVLQFKLVPERSEFLRLVQAIAGRPAALRLQAEQSAA